MPSVAVDYTPYYLSRIPDLKPSGSEHRAPCPIHNGEDPNFSVDLKTGRWKCHSKCDAGGDAYRLEQRLTGRPFPECKRAVDEMIGIVADEPQRIGRDGTVSSRSDTVIARVPAMPSPSSSPEKSKGKSSNRRLVATYDYHDADGALVYQVCKYEPKGFSQRRPDPDRPGSWVPGLNGVDRLLYRLAEVLSTTETVYITEGEKDADLARSWGLTATCNSGGAGKFTASMARELAGRPCVVLVDNDEPGEKHADRVARLLMGERCSVRLVRFDGVKEHGDLSDWAAMGNGRTELESLVATTPEWTFPGKSTRSFDGIPSSLEEMLENYIVLVGSEMIWDVRRSKTSSPSEIRLAHSADYTTWVKHPERRQIDIERLVFAPQGARDGEINTFRGLAIKPDPSKPCDRIKSHLASLCGNDPGLTHWLTCWLAYPLQHLGSKMKTSVVVHGVQGTGKSMLFEAVARIYGEYSAVIGQTQIDSAYTSWASRKLFVVADEVLSTREARTIKNRLKCLITGETIIIEEKYRTSRTEQNCMNLVFLSNENTPVIVEREDRRFTVIRFDDVLGEDYYNRLANEIHNGGIESFMAYLMAYDLGGFNEHAKPYKTDAKKELIEVSLSSTDRFLDMWQGGELPVPFGPATALDLFHAYEVWVKESGERFGIATATAFGRIAGHRFPREQKRLRDGRRSTVYMPRDGMPEDFADHLSQWREKVKFTT
jgi:hypothetical protein